MSNYPKSIMLLGLALLSFSACPTSAISPWFTSSFLHMQHALGRFTRCQNLEPLVDYNQTAELYLVNQMNNFFDVANFDQDNVNATIRLFENICQNRQVYSIVGELNTTEFAVSKTLRCQTLDDVMDVLYDEFKRAALNQTVVLNFDEFYYDVRANSSKHLISYLNTAWIQANFSKEDACSITNQVVRHLQQIQPTIRRADQKPASMGEGLLGRVKSYLDPLFSLYTRAYLFLTTEAAEARMFVSSGLHATSSLVRGGFTRVGGWMGRGGPVPEEQNVPEVPLSLSPTASK